MGFNLWNIAMCGIMLWGGMMILSIILIFISLFIDWFSKYHFLNNVSITILDIGTYILYSGLTIFIRSIASICLQMAFDGLTTGEYNLKYSRYWNSKVHFTWDENPLWFTFQTTMFVGFSIWSIYFSWKQFRDFYKKNKTSEK